VSDRVNAEPGLASDVASTLRSLGRYIRGGQQEAEELQVPPVEDVAGWPPESTDEAVLRYAVDISRVAVQDARDSLDSVQNKAAALSNLALGLAPVVVGLSSIAVSNILNGPWPVIGCVLAIALNFFLLLAIVRSFLAVSSVPMGSVSLARLGAESQGGVAGMQRLEISGWLYAWQLAVGAGQLRARHLFVARRFLVLAVMLGPLLAGWMSIPNASTTNRDPAASDATPTISGSASTHSLTPAVRPSPVVPPSAGAG
jgi:hypothetical protein